MILAISRWFALLRLISVKLFNVVNNPFNTFRFVCRVKAGGGQIWYRLEVTAPAGPLFIC